jgi:hypothetical protein
MTTQWPIISLLSADSVAKVVLPKASEILRGAGSVFV